ncbi:BC_2427 family protein [Bacillus cereus group sp. RP32]|uniref:BC_2427 family protein n=1 Tax=Bacillus cereus group sp. RP32 TaxID=3040258 RepID=UPI003399B4F6
MNKPWIGKALWDEIHKYKDLNKQDNSRERIVKKEEEVSEVKKEEEVSEVKKEEEVSEVKKEEEVSEVKKEEEVSEVKKEEEVSEVKKEEEVSEVKKEEEASEVKKEEEVSEVKKEEEVPEVKKEEEVSKVKKEEEVSEVKKENATSESQIEPSVRSMVVKTPFSIISEVSSFKIFPKINIKNQEEFVFQNEKDVGRRELDSKLLTTVQQYHSEAYCEIVSFNLHEKRVLMELYNKKVIGNIEENKVETSSWTPIHSIVIEGENEGEINNVITAKLPIEIGKYKGEIILREKVVFKEKVIGIKEVEQEIVLTKTEFLVPKVIKNRQNTFTVEKGSLFVEGYIYQCIEYISEQSTFHNNVYQLMQNIVLELVVQVIQEQEVQVRIN